MKKVTLLTVILLTFIGGIHSLAQISNSRKIISFNDNWLFTKSNPTDAFRLKYDDASWEPIQLPHCWNVKDPYEEDDDYYRGIGWYRKKVTFSESYKNKKIFLVFDGANQVSDLYVNGFPVGRHKGGYTAFIFDITPYIKLDGTENIIAVQVNNATDLYIPPIDVGYTIYGGIYRNVRLLITDNIHFSTDNFGSSGIFVSTPSVSEKSALVSMKGSCKNETLSKQDIQIVNTLTDADYKAVTTFSNNYTLEANKKLDFQFDNIAIANPKLWSPENPQLYQLTTQIIKDGNIVDEIVSTIGFRWYRFDADSGFFLNGKKYLLKGTNRHQDMMGKGSALTKEDHENDLQSIKNMGCNFLRLAHYPQDPYVLKRANEIGLLIWEEVPVVNLMKIDPEFLSNAGNMIKEMIRQHYNNPSVIMWGSMNEIFLNDNYNNRTQKIIDSTYGVNVSKYGKVLDSIVRAEDPYRSSTIAMHMSSDYDKFKIDVIPQVASYNIYSGWYGGKVDEFGKSFDKKHAEKPEQVIFISEYGAESDNAVNTEKPTRLDNTGQYQRYFHESYLEQIQQRPYLAGTAIWNQFDFGNPNIGGTISNINHKGMYTWDRKPKDVYYFYKANWNPQPMIYIASRDWSHRAGLIGDSSTIDVYTNAPTATLIVNGKSLSSKSSNSLHKITWKALFKNGVNTIVAKATKNHQIIADTFQIMYDVFDSTLSNNSKSAIKINAGSNAQFIDATHAIWLQDMPYKKGAFGYVRGKPSFISLKGKITKTDKVQLLYTYLDSVKDYRIDVADGNYQVELYFAEPEYHETGKRVFDVSINNKKVITDFDLFKESGYCEAIKKSFIITTTNKQGIQLHFDAKKGNPILNGISIVPVTKN